MDIIIFLVQMVAAVAGALAAILTIPLFLRLHWPAPVLWFIKLYSSALSAWLAAIAALVIPAGIVTGSPLISLPACLPA